MKETTQNAIQQTHNLSMSGGNDKTTYTASINYSGGDGVAINTGYSRLNGRLNLSQKAINDRLTVDLNIGATNRDRSKDLTMHSAMPLFTIPTAPVKSDDAQYEQYDGYFQQVLFDYYNPVPF